MSVVIPVLDEVDHVDACLEALSRQTLGVRPLRGHRGRQRGRPTGPSPRLDAWPDLTVLHEPHARPLRGPQPGRAGGARGRVLAFTDGDCTASPDWLDRLREAFVDPGTEVVVGRLAYPGAASFWLERYAEYYDAKTRWVFETPVPECFLRTRGEHGGASRGLRPPRRLREALPCPGDTELLHRVRADRGDGAVRYVADLVVTHVEIETLRDLLPKLRHYGRYSAALATTRAFRALTTPDSPPGDGPLRARPSLRRAPLRRSPRGRGARWRLVRARPARCAMGARLDERSAAWRVWQYLRVTRDVIGGHLYALWALGVVAVVFRGLRHPAVHPDPCRVWWPRTRGSSPAS